MKELENNPTLEIQNNLETKIVNKKRKQSILKSECDFNNNITFDKKVEFKEFPQVIPVTSYKKYNAEIEDYGDLKKKKTKCIKCRVF